MFEKLGISKNKKLALVLTGIAGDLGALTDELDFSMQVGLLNHYYARGSMYPKEGTIDIIKSLSATVL